MRMTLFAAMVAALSLLSGSVFARQAQAPQHAGHDEVAREKKRVMSPEESDAEIVRNQGPTYPLTKCVVTGDAFGTNEKPIDYVLNGRLVRLCCEDCKKDVDKDPAAVIKVIDDAVVAAQKPTYPLTTDPVTGSDLGEDAIDYVYGTRLVRLTSRKSVAAFEKDPETALAKVNQGLIEAQLKTYPLTTCVVSDEELGGEMGAPINILHGTRLVRLCCDGCLPKFNQDPAKYLAIIDAAAKLKSKSDH